MDHSYWDKYYKHPGASRPTPPSQFAAFTLSEIIGEDTLLIDLGCGNGRDSALFSQFGVPVIGIDSSEEAICACTARNLVNCDFIAADVSDPRLCDKIKNCLPSPSSFSSYTIYARFFFHAITDEQEAALLRSLQSLLGTSGRIFLEFRTDRDANLTKATEPHFRRYLKPYKLIERLLCSGFHTDYFVEGFGFAKYGNDDAHLGRIISSPVLV